MKFLLATISLLCTVSGAVIKNDQIQSKCVKGVQIFAARGTNENPGEGRLQVLSGLIEAGIPGSKDQAVVYPASFVPINESEEEGVEDLMELIHAYVGKCPNARLVLTGYSQGGQVVSDVLGGGSYTNSPPLDEKYRSNILAAVVFGDPTRTSNKTYNYGNSTLMGVLPRLDTARLDSYAPHYGSWCTSGDPVCDDGTDINAHVTEVETWEGAAAKFVINLWKHRQ